MRIIASMWLEGFLSARRTLLAQGRVSSGGGEIGASGVGDAVAYIDGDAGASGGGDAGASIINRTTWEMIQGNTEHRH